MRHTANRRMPKPLTSDVKMCRQGSRLTSSPASSAQHTPDEENQGRGGGRTARWNAAATIGVTIPAGATAPCASGDTGGGILNGTFGVAVVIGGEVTIIALFVRIHDAIPASRR